MKYRFTDKLLMQDVADEMVLLHPETGVYFTLDPVGARMLNLLKDLGDEEAVADAIVGEYEVEKPKALEDLYKLLEQMVEHGLTERMDGEEHGPAA